MNKYTPTFPIDRRDVLVSDKLSNAFRTDTAEVTGRQVVGAAEITREMVYYDNGKFICYAVTCCYAKNPTALERCEVKQIVILTANMDRWWKYYTEWIKQLEEIK